MDNVRTFVSIPVPNASDLGPLIRELKGVRGVRTSSTTQMHITLAFLGDIPEERVDEVEECVKEAVSGVKGGRITLKGVGAFPNQRAPRVVWAGVETEIPLAAVADGIRRRLVAKGLPCDEKPFKPHITVARVENKPDLSRILRNYSASEFASFICRSVLVIKSELSPSGATHTIMRMCELK